MTSHRYASTEQGPVTVVVAPSHQQLGQLGDARRQLRVIPIDVLLTELDGSLGRRGGFVEKAEIAVPGTRRQSRT